MPKIYAFHLLNDFSGSPKVLRQALEGYAAAGYEVSLNTSCSTTGFLSNIPGVRMTDNRYRFVHFLPLRLSLLLFSQLYSLLSCWKRVGREDIVFINTLLPFGAALLGRLRGARVVYHLHETSVNPPLFKQFLLFWVNNCASEVIYVSNFLAEAEPVDRPAYVIWNALPEAFAARAAECGAPGRPVERVLMIASLKRYKGVDEYVALAASCPGLQFELVVNAAPAGISAYFANQELPANLTIFPAQRDVHPFYCRADVLLNLSRPDEWVETFGLTALEGMAYGLPVIVPPVGGIAEIVPNGVAGYHLNGRDTAAIVAKLREWRVNGERYHRMSQAAIAQAARFSEGQFVGHLLDVLKQPAASSHRSKFQAVEEM